MYTQPIEKKLRHLTEGFIVKPLHSLHTYKDSLVLKNGQPGGVKKPYGSNRETIKSRKGY